MQFSATGSICIKTKLSEATGTQTELLSKTSVKKSGQRSQMVETLANVALAEKTSFEIISIVLLK